jgi:hypothetical protein
LKICIVSDSHDHREPLAAAVAEAYATAMSTAPSLSAFGTSKGKRRCESIPGRSQA